MSDHLRVFARHGSNMGMALGLAGMAAWLVGHARPATPAWIVVGVLMLPLFEYVFHRFILHTPPSKIRWVRRFQDVIHYEHHEDLARVERYFCPLWLGFPLVLTQAALYTALGATPVTTVALLFGNMAGFLYYEWVHYMAHAPYVPRTRLGKFQKKYHMWHHHKNENYWFGVTTPVVDMLVGTYKRVDQVPTSPTARRLYGE